MNKKRRIEKIIPSYRSPRVLGANTDVINNCHEATPYQLIKKIQDNFCATLDISLAIYDVDGNVIAKELNIKSFWKNYVSGNPLVYPKCKTAEINAIKTCIDKKSIYIYPVYCGISAFAVPIIIGDKIAAVCVGGKARTENPNLKLCKTEAENIKADFNSFLEEYLDMPFMENKRLNSIAILLKQITETILELHLSKRKSKEKIDEMEIMKDMLQKEIYSKTKNIHEVHQKYKSIVENAIDIILTMNKDGIITEINKSIENSLWETREKIIGSHFSEFVHPEAVSEVQKLIENAAEKKIDKVTDTIIPIYDMKDKLHYFSISAKVVYGNDNSLTEIQCIMHDITKQKKLEEELRKTKDQYMHLFESIKYGIYLADTEGNIINANESMCELFGYDKDELKNIKAWNLYSNPEEIKKITEQVIRSKDSAAMETMAINKNEGEFYAELGITTIKNDKSDTVGHSCIVRNISNRIEYISKARGEEMKYKTLFDNLQEGIIITDEKGEILEYNKKASHIFKKCIDLSVNIKKLVVDITPDKIARLKKKGQIDIEYPINLNEMNKTSVVFSITGILIKFNGKTRFQWILKETCKIDYVRQKQHLGHTQNISMETEKKSL